MVDSVVASNAVACASRASQPGASALLEARRDAVVQALQHSGAPEAARLEALLIAGFNAARDPAAQHAHLQKYERALADRGSERNMVSDLLLNVLNSAMSGLAWRTVAGAAPATGSVLALGHLAQAVYQRRWNGVAAALPALVTLLPSLRNAEQIEALINGLPQALRDQLDSLHQWVQQSDDALTPDLGLRHLGPALAVAALLWHLQSRLPSPSGQLQGVAHFIARLPQYWQRLVGLDRTGATLFAPPPGPYALMSVDDVPRLDAKRLPREVKAQLVAHKRAFDRQYATAGNVTTLPPFEPATVDATSSATTLVGSWCTWLMGAAGVASGFNPVAQNDPLDAMEMVDLGGSEGPAPPDVIAPLVEQVLPAVGTGIASRASGIVRRNPVAATVIAGMTAAGAVAGFLRALGTPEPVVLSIADIADTLANEVVSVGSAWGTGVDLLLGTPELPDATRRKRDLSGQFSTGPTSTTSSTASPEGDLTQLGLTDAQRDQLLANGPLTDDLRSLQAWSLAVSQQVARQPGWEWVRQLPASEQVLLMTQLHTLRALLPALDTAQSQPQVLLDEALQASGCRPSAGILVDLGPTQVAGVTVQQRMPLLAYCLLRADGSTPARVTFLQDGVLLPDTTQASLQAFVSGRACRDLGDPIRKHAESLRPVLVSALKARLVIDAIKAKAQGRLGSGDVQLRGAEIVLGFLQGRPDVESAALTYVDTLADGTAFTVRVPQYLVLRSASSDRDLHGQVVLYRADLARFQSFGNEAAFRQFLDAQRASAGLHVVDGAIDTTLGDDIVAAAPPALRAQVQERVRRWEQRQALFQTGKHGPQAWNARDSFVLAFQPVTAKGHALRDWADALVDHRQQQEQQQLDDNRLRWTPLGMARADADAAFALHLEADLQSLQAHARPTVVRELVRALRLAGFGGDLSSFDPDQIELRIGGHVMRLTAWAINGWQQHGPTPPWLPASLGALPAVDAALPAHPQPLEPWPGTEDLFAMDFTAYGPDGDAMTRYLLDEDARRAICTVLTDFASSNQLAEAYIDHLTQLAATPGSGLHLAVADQIRTHLRWMIERAQQHGALDVPTCEALKAAHAQLEPGSGHASSLKAVTLNGHPIIGLWALPAHGTHYVFLPGTAAGDQLLDETAFRAWLREPGAEAYVLARCALRYHASLEAMFRRKQAAQGITLGFEPTRGPRQAAAAFIQARIADVDEMTVSQLERLGQTMTWVGSAVVAATCSLASAGTLAAACVISTMGLVIHAFREAADLLDRRDVDGALQEIGAALADAVDVLSVGKVPALLLQLGRRGLASVGDAGDALRQWQRQARGFAADGRVNDGFATPRQTLSDTGLPMLERDLPGGATVYHQNGREYLQQDAVFVETYVADGEDVRRLRMPDAPDQAGPPVEHANGQWQRLQTQASPPGGTTPRAPTAPRATTPLPPGQRHHWVQRVPEAETLPADTLDELETVFGIRRAGTPTSADLRQKVRDLTMEDRIRHIIDHPAALGLPGDEAIILRGWADSRALGNGKSVETYSLESGEWTRGVRFGKGPVGLLVEVDDARQLPRLEALVDASDIDALLQRLNLPADTPHDVLLDAVRAELVRTIASDPAQSLLSWQRWSTAQHRLPTAADNLIKHFPELTKIEAEALTASDTWLAHQALSWIFPSDTARKVADVLALRTQRTQRKGVLDGNFDSPSKVQELGRHLQNVLPDTTWRVTSDPSGSASVLSFTRTDEKENAVRRLTFSTNGELTRPTAGGGTELVTSWEDGIYDQLSPVGRQHVPTAHALREAVVERMKDTPLVSTCALPKRVGKGKALMQRSPDCDPPPSIALSDDDVMQRDTLGRLVHRVRTRMSDKHALLSLEEQEFKQLAAQNLLLKKQKKVLEPDALARFRELEKKQFGNLKSFDIMNFASYQLEGVKYKGAPVVLPDTFPAQGTATSGNPRPILATEGLIEGAPVRYVLLTDEALADNPSLTGWYPEDYAMGADLTPVIVGRGIGKGQSSAKVTLTEKDLLVTRPGTKQKVPVYELSDDDIIKLDFTGYSPMLRKYLGDASLHPANARTLKPGEYRLYQIRSCSEGKILDGWFSALSTAVPELSPKLYGAHAGPLGSLTGNLYIFSEMNPCAVSCEVRLARLMELMHEMNFLVFYRYDNNLHRSEWIMEQKLSRIIDRNRDEWEAANVPEGEMRAKAHAELLKPDVSQWLESDFKNHPMDEPVARLWLPTETNEF